MAASNKSVSLTDEQLEFLENLKTQERRSLSSLIQEAVEMLIESRQNAGNNFASGKPIASSSFPKRIPPPLKKRGAA